MLTTKSYSLKSNKKSNITLATLPSLACLHEVINTYTIKWYKHATILLLIKKEKTKNLNINFLFLYESEQYNSFPHECHYLTI